jgi:hypothetical protein
MITFRSEFEATEWFRMVRLWVENGDPDPYLSADVSISHFRDRFTPDQHLAPHEVNALANAGYRFEGGDGTWIKQHGNVEFRFRSWALLWSRNDKSSTTTWTRAQPLSEFLREVEKEA